jgi:predicted ATPase with chaperone activity
MTAVELTSMHPLAPKTLEETGLNTDLVQQLLLKTLYFGGELTGADVAKRVGLAFSVFEAILEFLKQQRLCEISGGSVFGGASYRYRLTEGGRSRAAAALEQNQYVGVAPVPLDQYRRYMVELKKGAPLNATREHVREAFAHLVVSDGILDAVGPAVNSGHSLFVYGSPGNGKTMIAQGIRNLLIGDMAIPHAVVVDGSILQVFERVRHEEVPIEEERSEGLERSVEFDKRWVRCRRPLVMVGGELTMEDLELRYNAISGFYRAPVQMVANGGVLVIDDFGRQHCSPRDLLNRWIVPLETRIDFLTLQTGQSLEIPFMVLLVFATNLKPTELADEAFLRRIQYKIFAESPGVEAFIRIFENYCRAKEILFDRVVVEQMLAQYYRPNKIPLRGCQPRDLINQALALANYMGQPRQLTVELMEAACRSYFVHDRQVPDTFA